VSTIVAFKRKSGRGKRRGLVAKELSELVKNKRRYETNCKVNRDMSQVSLVH
jgi:hypothetical protein